MSASNTSTAVPREGDSPRASRTARSRISSIRVAPATAVFVGMLLVTTVILLVATRHFTFFYDEWDFILHRRGSGVSTYLDPANGHLVLFPVIVYKLLFAIVGLRHYTAYVLVDIALDLICGTLLYVLVRRRLGPWLALVPAGLLMLMGTAYQDLTWPFQICFLGSIAGGLGAFLALDRGDLLGDLIAAALLAWSLSSSAVGLAFLVAAAVLLIARGWSWRRAWVIAVPAALFALWYLGWGQHEHVTLGVVLHAPQYVANAAADAVAGIAGVDPSWGPALAVGALVLIMYSWRRAGLGLPTPMLLAAIAGALTFWGLAATIRTNGVDPGASRYLYVGAVFIWLVVAEARVATNVSGPWLALAGLAVAGALIANLGALRDSANDRTTRDASVRASLAAVDIARRYVSPAFVPDPVNAPVLVVGPYVAAVNQLGSPAYTTGELLRAPETARAQADKVLMRVEGIFAASGPSRIAGTQPLNARPIRGDLLQAQGPCRELVPRAYPAVVQVRLPVGSVLEIANERGGEDLLFARRFASKFSRGRVAQIPPGSTRTIRFPVDRLPGLSWHVQVVANGRVSLCES